MLVRTIKYMYSSNGLLAEQLKELKMLLDNGLITQEDYEQKKKQILGL